MALVHSGANVRSHCRGRGFTLVELLVVVAIIALLISLLVPALAAAKYRAKLTTCSANMRGLGLGMFNYASENTDMFPPYTVNAQTFRIGVPMPNLHFYWGWPDQDGGYAANQIYYPGMVPSYITSPKMFYCPVAVQTNGLTAENSYNHWIGWQFETACGYYIEGLNCKDRGSFNWDNFYAKRTTDGIQPHDQAWNPWEYNHNLPQKLAWDLSWDGIQYSWEAAYINHYDLKVPNLPWKPLNENMLYNDMHVELIPYNTPSGYIEGNWTAVGG